MKLSSYSVIKAVKSSSPNSRVDKVNVNINISGWGAVLLTADCFSHYFIFAVIAIFGEVAYSLMSIPAATHHLFSSNQVIWCSGVFG